MTHKRPHLRYPALHRTTPPLVSAPLVQALHPAPEPLPPPPFYPFAVSVILPTRMRPKRLLDAVKSIYATAAFPHDVQVVVRMHEDDAPTLKIRDKLPPGCKVIVGPYVDFGNQANVAWDACNAAEGVWLWGFSDDVTVDARSKGWDAQVMKLPTTGIIAMPEWNCLGGAKFRHDGAHPFFFVPNRWWVKFGFTTFQNPTDAWILGVLRAAGWETTFLPGIKTLHDRKKDALMKSEGRG